MSASECAPCGERFAGVTAFDRHQDRDYTRTPPVICRPPANCGLVRNEHGRWGFPLNAACRAYFAARAAEHARAGAP